ncbi:Protein argonaute-2 [Mycena sanguinolenta]|uniref:Protein argonaute-2 n=1 Tax=Mycena sanguinolenta TaxID=230812 RepID=A0A8H6YDZ7_9AGAR|nr:Protein argonaute-2 [Mycena sanguinolenta]
MAASVEPPNRFGTFGDPTRGRVYTNAFELPLTFPPRTFIFHYDVVITPGWVPKTEVKFNAIKSRDIIVRLQQQEPRIFNPVGAFDGKRNLFSFKRYPFASQSFKVRLDTDGQRQTKAVNVMVTYTREVDLQILRNLRQAPHQQLSSTLNLLNVFVQAQPKKDHLFNATSVFKYNERTIDKLSIAPLQLWRGVFQSVRPTFDRIVVNVDTTVGVVVPEESLVWVCQNYLRLRHLDAMTAHQFRELRLFLRGVKVVANHVGRQEPRTLKIRDLVDDVGAEVFEKIVRDGNSQHRVRISVAQHFLDTYNMTIRPRTLGVKGTRELFPITCCKTVEQLYRNKLSPDKAAKVLKFGLKNPREKFTDIKTEWAALDHRESEFLRGGGITFSASSNPLEVDGRILEPPKISYGASQYHPKGEIQVLERPGSWNMMEKTLFRPASVSSWVIVDFTQRSNSTKLTRFLRNLVFAMKNLGMAVSDPQQMAGNPQTADRVLTNACGTHKPNLLVVVLNEFDADLYVKVKRFGDIEHGIPTQCIKWNKNRWDASDRATSQYHANLILKINARMGGVNFVPPRADVSHPSPQSTLPSVAGVVSSWDPQACRYGASVRLQRSRLEIIEDLEAMVLDALDLFWRKNKCVPQRIYYFRDGVSEGQFEAIFSFENTAILNACREFAHFPLDEHKKKRVPNVAFIVCGKKHHTKFFPRDHSSTDTAGKHNCYAGLVVDRDFSHPHYVDFYLQSQQGLQGTSRPTHFTILSETRPSMNLMQALTYALCHCYSRATKSVKIPAPVYYADLICSRAKFHYDEDVDYFDDISVNSSDPGFKFKQLEYYVKHFHPVHPNLRDTMYFV